MFRQYFLLVCFTVLNSANLLLNTATSIYFLFGFYIYIVYYLFYKVKYEFTLFSDFSNLISLCVEIIQGLLGIGASDIDDIILNCLGGWIGILGYKFLLLLLLDDKKVHTVIKILSTIVGLPVLLYLLFIVRLRL